MAALSGETLGLALVFALVALVYASVGQAGASGYIAAMGLFGMAPAAMKTTALALNTLVAAIGTFQFGRAGLLTWRTAYPFALLGVPFSLAGGAVQLPPSVYYPAVGVILILSAVQMVRSARRRRAPALRIEPPPFFPALVTGAVIGFVSGTTGTGGGVFLAPILLGMNWATARQTAATSAVYNLMNSAAALAGAYGLWPAIPAAIGPWLLAVGAGGWLGATLGSRYLPEIAMRYVLAVLLFASGLRLALG
jgi:uncharacterized protein